MLARKNRFQGRRDPRIVLKHGKTVRGAGFQLRYLFRTPPTGEFRAAVIVSTKVTKSAPLRNRIRRRVYEVLREINLPLPIDLVVLVYDKNLADSDFEQLKSSIAKLFSQAKQ